MTRPRRSSTAQNRLSIIGGPERRRLAPDTPGYRRVRASRQVFSVDTDRPIPRAQGQRSHRSADTLREMGGGGRDDGFTESAAAVVV
jgi:hypothetical protein